MERPMPGDAPISPNALEAIGELLQAGAQHGLGVAFEPDGEGWKISYILYDWPAHRDYELPAGLVSPVTDHEREAGDKVGVTRVVTRNSGDRSIRSNSRLIHCKQSRR